MCDYVDNINNQENIQFIFDNLKGPYINSRSFDLSSFDGKIINSQNLDDFRKNFKKKNEAGTNYATQIEIMICEKLYNNFINSDACISEKTNNVDYKKLVSKNENKLIFYKANKFFSFMDHFEGLITLNEINKYLGKKEINEQQNVIPNQITENTNFKLENNISFNNSIKKLTAKTTDFNNYIQKLSHIKMLNEDKKQLLNYVKNYLIEGSINKQKNIYILKFLKLLSENETTIEKIKYLRKYINKIVYNFNFFKKKPDEKTIEENLKYFLGIEKIDQSIIKKLGINLNEKNSIDYFKSINKTKKQSKNNQNTNRNTNRIINNDRFLKYLREYFLEGPVDKKNKKIEYVNFFIELIKKHKTTLEKIKYAKKYINKLVYNFSFLKKNNTKIYENLKLFIGENDNLIYNQIKQKLGITLDEINHRNFNIFQEKRKEIFNMQSIVNSNPLVSKFRNNLVNNNNHNLALNGIY